MAITRVRASAVNAATSSATVTLSGTPTSGNLLIGFLTANKATSVHAMPAGWTQLKTYDRTSPTVVGLTAWVRTAGASEPTGITGTATAATVTNLAVLEYSGLAAIDATHGLSPFDWWVERDSGGVSVTSTDCGPLLGTRTANEVWLSVVAGATITGIAWTNGFAVAVSATGGRIAVGEKIVSATGDADTVASWTTAAAAMMGFIFAFGDTQLEPQFSGWGQRI